MGSGLGLAELGNKAELNQLGLELWLNWSPEDFPGWGGGGGVGEKLGIKLKLRFSLGLGLAELGKKLFVLAFNLCFFIKNYQGLFYPIANKRSLSPSK